MSSEHRIIVIVPIAVVGPGEHAFHLVGSAKLADPSLRTLSFI